MCNLRRRLLRAAYGEQRFCTHRRTAIVALLSTPAPEDVSQEGGSPPRVARTGHGQPPAAYDLLPLRYCWFLTRADSRTPVPRMAVPAMPPVSRPLY